MSKIAPRRRLIAHSTENSILIRRGCRFQKDLDDQLNRPTSQQLRDQLQKNEYFLELSEVLTKQQIQQLLDNINVEIITPKDYITIRPTKLYFTLSQSALLSPKVGSESPDINPSVIEDFMKKYEDVKNDDEVMYEKRISVLYHMYFLIKNAERPYVFGMHSFFTKNIEKSTEIIITKTKAMILSFDRDKIRKELFRKMSHEYKQRVEFLRSFPLLSAIPQLYFHAYMPSMFYKKYLVGNLIPQHDSLNTIYFLRTGEIQFSKLENEEEVKVYKITGQQMFQIIDDIDIIKATSEAVIIYALQKKDLDFLMLKSDYDRNKYEQLLDSIRKYNIKLKQRACQFHSTNSRQNQKKQPVDDTSPVTKKSLFNINVSTKQFNQYMETIIEKKSILQSRLMMRFRNPTNSFFVKGNSKKNLQQKQSQKQNQKEPKYEFRFLSKRKMLEFREYKEFKENSRENSIVSMYKSLVESGLEEKLRVAKTKPNSRVSSRSRKMVHSALSTMTDLSQIRLQSISSCHTKFNN